MAYTVANVRINAADAVAAADWDAGAIVIATNGHLFYSNTFHLYRLLAISITLCCFTLICFSTDKISNYATKLVYYSFLL